MKYLLELAKDHETLLKSEIMACLKSEDINYKILTKNNDVIIFESKSENDKIKNFANRISSIYFVDDFLFESPLIISKIHNSAIKNPIKNPGSIAVKYKNRSKSVNSQEIIKTVASVYTKNRKVRLKKPDIEIRCIITDDRVYVGMKLFQIDRQQFEKRKVQFRPFFSPISLHPKLARALVNLSGVKKNHTLLDPFCGTGGILLEAGLIGIKVIGNDIEQKMIDGCKKTLNFYKINEYNLFCSDVGDINKYVSKIDAVVTDLPYGKSTTTKGEEKKNLYKRSFEIISNVMSKNTKAVIGFSDKNMISLAENYLKFVESHELKVHKSLTRYFVVFEK